MRFRGSSGSSGSFRGSVKDFHGSAGSFHGCTASCFQGGIHASAGFYFTNMCSHLLLPLASFNKHCGITLSHTLLKTMARYVRARITPYEEILFSLENQEEKNEL